MEAEVYLGDIFLKDSIYDYKDPTLSHFITS